MPSGCRGWTISWSRNGKGWCWDCQSFKCSFYASAQRFLLPQKNSALFSLKGPKLLMPDRFNPSSPNVARSIVAISNPPDENLPSLVLPFAPPQQKLFNEKEFATGDGQKKELSGCFWGGQTLTGSAKGLLTWLFQLRAARLHLERIAVPRIRAEWRRSLQGGALLNSRAAIQLYNRGLLDKTLTSWCLYVDPVKTF